MGPRRVSVLYFIFAASAWAQFNFQAPVTNKAQNGPVATVSADFNGDGKPDIAVGNARSGSVSVFFNSGSGTFTTGPVITFPSLCNVMHLIAGDFNNDGKVDILATCGFQTSLWVIPGAGGGQFGTPIPTQLPANIDDGFGGFVNFQGSVAADFNGDGKLDLALILGPPVSLSSNLEVNFLPGKGDGTFGAPVPLDTSQITFAFNIAAADLNGDGKPDLLVLNASSTAAASLYALLGNGDGTFRNLLPFQMAGGAGASYMVLADINHDGIPDLIASGATSTDSSKSGITSAVTVFTGNGDGTFKQTFSFPEQDLVPGLAVADFRGTGAVDLLEVNIGNTSTDVFLLRAGNGDGTFQTAQIISPQGGLAWMPTVLTADWNGDGLPDLAYTQIGGVTGTFKAQSLSDVVAFYQQFPAGNLTVQLNGLTPPAASAISVSNSRTQFAFTAGGTAPVAQSFAITSTAGRSLDWTATASASWISVSPRGGTTPGNLTISVTPGAMPPGAYQGFVEVAGAGASNGPLAITVTLTISSAAVVPQITSVVNGASFQAGFESGSWVTIKGSNLANTNPGRTWTASEIVNGKLPTALDGVAVTINGLPAYVYYISPGQLNVQAPADTTLGPVSIVVNNNGAVSTAFTGQLQAFAPAFFLYTGTASAIATRYPDNALIGDPSLISGTVAAKPGDVLILWATGFGATSPLTPAGTVVVGAPAASTLPTVTVGGTPVQVIYSVLSPGSAGLYQVAIQLPGSVPLGTVAVQATVGGFQSPPAVTIYVASQ